jgi:hypothetical protein
MIDPLQAAFVADGIITPDPEMETVIELPEHITRRAFGDVAYQSPEVILGKLRACTVHYCRTVNCENIVPHCGDTCMRCAGEIEGLRQHYAEENRKAAGAFWPMASLALLAFAAACYVGAVKAGWL